MKSLSEIDTTSKRATRAAGFSWGIAEEVGKNKKGVDKSHSFSYNGTSRFDTLREQEEYCYNKIMHQNFDTEANSLLFFGDNFCCSC